jgi:uroporphyrinogen-III synthase
MTTEDGALRGRTIMVTRTREQAEGLVDSLHERGATVVVVPLISTVPIARPEEIVSAAARTRAAPAPRWVAFTSATAARLVLGAAGADALSGVRIAAVGPATAAALRGAGLEPEVVAADHDASGLAAAMRTQAVEGATVWFPAAEGARDTLAEALRAAGAAVTVQAIYRSAMPDGAAGRVRAALAGGVDAITLTSGSTARHLAAALEGSPLPSGVRIVCIGDRTAADAITAGLPVHAVATESSAEGLVEALTGCLTPQPLP